MRRSSGVFYSDPVDPSDDTPSRPSRGPRLKHIRATRRPFGTGQFDFTSAPDGQRDGDVPGIASLATSPASNIYLPPSMRDRESTPLLSEQAASNPGRLGFADSPAADSAFSLRPSTIGRRRISGAAGRRMSMDRRSVRSRKNVVMEKGESTDGQTVSGRIKPVSLS